MIASISKYILDQLIEKYIHEQEIDIQEVIDIYIQCFQQIQTDFTGFYKIFVYSGFYCESNADASSQLLQNFINTRCISNLYTKCFLTDEQFVLLLNLNQYNQQVALTLEYNHLYDAAIQTNITTILSKTHIIKKLYNDTGADSEYKNTPLQPLYENIFDIPKKYLLSLRQVIICNIRIRAKHNLSSFLQNVPQLNLVKLDKCHIRESDFDIKCLIQMPTLRYVSLYDNHLGFQTFSEFVLHIFTGEHQIRHFNISNNNIFKGVSDKDINNLIQKLIGLYAGFSNKIVQHSIPQNNSHLEKQKQDNDLLTKQQLDFNVKFKNYVIITNKTTFQLLIDGIGVGEVKKVDILKQQRCILIGVIIAGFTAGFELKLSMGGTVVSAISDIIDGFDPESFTHVFNGIQWGLSVLGINKVNYFDSIRTDNTNANRNTKTFNVSEQDLNQEIPHRHFKAVQIRPRITALHLQSNQLACRGMLGNKQLCDLYSCLSNQYSQRDYSNIPSQGNQLSYTHNQTLEISSIFPLYSINVSNTDVFHGWTSRNAQGCNFLSLFEQCSNLQEIHLNSENPQSSLTQLVEKLQNCMLAPKLKVLNVDEFMNINDGVNIIQARYKRDLQKLIEYHLIHLNKQVQNLNHEDQNQINLENTFDRNIIGNRVNNKNVCMIEFSGITQFSCKWSDKRLKSLKTLIDGLKYDICDIIERLFNSKERNLITSFLFTFDSNIVDKTVQVPKLDILLVDNSLFTSFFDVNILDILTQSLQRAKVISKENGLQWILQILGCDYSDQNNQKINELAFKQSVEYDEQVFKKCVPLLNERIFNLKNELAQLCAISYYQQLIILSVCGCKLLKPQIQNFSSFISANKQLRFLDVSYCSLNDTTGKIVIDAFMETNRIKPLFQQNKGVFLFIDKNQLGEDTFIAVKDRIIDIQQIYEHNMYCRAVVRITNIKMLSRLIQERIINELIKIKSRFFTIICQLEQNLLKKHKHSISFTIIKQLDTIKGQCLDFMEIVKHELGIETKNGFDHRLNLYDLLLYNLE